AHQRCPALDPDYPVVLGQLGHAGALLLAELYGFHLLLLPPVGRSTAPLRGLGLLRMRGAIPDPCTPWGPEHEPRNRPESRRPACDRELDPPLRHNATHSQ